jgi:hypothetical protein
MDVLRAGFTASCGLPAGSSVDLVDSGGQGGDPGRAAGSSILKGEASMQLQPSNLHTLWDSK